MSAPEMDPAALAKLEELLRTCHHSDLSRIMGAAAIEVMKRSGATLGLTTNDYTVVCYACGPGAPWLKRAFELLKPRFEAAELERERRARESPYGPDFAQDMPEGLGPDLPPDLPDEPRL